MLQVKRYLDMTSEAYRLALQFIDKGHMYETCNQGIIALQAPVAHSRVNGVFVPPPGAPQRPAYWTAAEELIKLLSVPLATTGDQHVNAMRGHVRKPGVSPYIFMQGWNHYWNAAAPFIVNMGLSRYDQGVAALGCLDVATSGSTNMYNEAMKEYQKGKLPPDWVLDDLVAQCQICFATEAYNKTRVKTHDLVTPQLDRKAQVTLGNSRGVSPVRSVSAERGRSAARMSPFTLTATPGPDNCTVHPSGSTKGFHTNEQCRSSKSPSRSPGPSNRVAVVSSATPLASALKATKKVIENNAQQALSLAETLAANPTLTRELETTRQQLKQARNILQGGGAQRRG